MFKENVNYQGFYLDSYPYFSSFYYVSFSMFTGFLPIIFYVYSYSQNCVHTNAYRKVENKERNTENTMYIK